MIFLQMFAGSASKRYCTQVQNSYNDGFSRQVWGNLLGKLAPISWKCYRDWSNVWHWNRIQGTSSLLKGSSFQEMFSSFNWIYWILSSVHSLDFGHLFFGRDRMLGKCRMNGMDRQLKISDFICESKIISLRKMVRIIWFS